MGNLFENMIVLEILKSQYNKGEEKSLYYFRDSKRFEIDLIIQNGRSIIPVEIKAASTFNAEFSKNLKKFAGFAKNAVNPTVIYNGNLECESDSVKYLNFKNCGSLVE